MKIGQYTGCAYIASTIATIIFTQYVYMAYLGTHVKTQ